MRMKYGIAILVLAGLAAVVLADLELTMDIEYPRRLELKIPVQEDSDFEMSTSFGDGEFFAVTGHVGRITGVTTNRTIDLVYGYQYDLGRSKGSATGSGTHSLDGSVSVRIVSSIWSANPRFVIREVAPPPRPDIALTNMTILTNVTWSASSNATEKAAQQGKSSVRGKPRR